MDVNEEIVRVWLQEKGFLVRERLKFKVKGARKAPGYADVDLIGYRLSDRKYVAVDISAWMTENITLSYLKAGSDNRHRLLKITDPEYREAIRKYLGVANDDQYEIWLVVSFISKIQYETVKNELLKYVDEVFEFPEIMNFLIEKIKENPKMSRETESLQTIRALVLCGLL